CSLRAVHALRIHGRLHPEILPHERTARPSVHNRGLLPHAHQAIAPNWCRENDRLAPCRRDRQAPDLPWLAIRYNAFSMKRSFVVLLVAFAAPPSRLYGAPRPFSVVEASIPAMRTAMQQRRITSRGLVTQCLVRIALYEDKLRAAITVNPRALEEAAD